MKTVNNTLKWQWLRTLSFWNRQPIRAQGGILALIPFIAIAVTFFLTYYGNSSRAAIETDIERKFQIVNQLNEVLVLMVNAETGMRGFMLTRRREFLEPYQTALQQLPPALDNLNKLDEAEPGAKPRAAKLGRLQEIKTQIDVRLEYLKDTEGSASRRETETEIFERLKRGKILMDELREMLSQSESEEQTLLAEQLNNIKEIRSRDYFLVIAALLIGLVTRLVSFYLFDRGIVRRIERLTENVRSWRSNENLKHPFSKKTDALGLLENELEELARDSGKISKVSKSN